MDNLLRDPVLLTKQYKNHTVPNAIEDLSLAALPAIATSVHLQPIRKMSVTIQILDEKDGTVIDSITGLSISGSVNMTSSSLIRRTATLTMRVTEDTFPKPGSLIWFNKYVKFYVGLKDFSTSNSTVNFLLGTFWIDEASFSLNESANEIQIDLKDKMTLWDEKKLEGALTIAVDTPISVAIRKMMEHIGETEFGFIADSLDNEVVPYTMKFNVGDDAITVITQLRDMYMDYICGYDIQGKFEFRKIEVQKADEVAEPKWRFDSRQQDRADLTLSFSESYSLKNIKNRIIVYGGTSDKTGYTPIGESRITDPKSPFNVHAIGERTDIIQEDKYVTNDQCISKAKYTIWSTSNFQEVCQISSLPIYILDAYDTIQIVHPVTGLVSSYIIDSFSYDLSPDAKMNISAHKLYYISVEYGEEKNDIVEAIVRGIMNWGWLSIGERRVMDCYNIMGSGKATLSVRFQDVAVGNEQASVTSYPTTKNQTMMIDLADLADMDLNDENGKSPSKSKGDYFDRVLAHEMFHAVCNDYFGHDLMVQMPTWFKEGFAEFIHGAKERYTSVYSSETAAGKKTKLIDLAKKLLDNDWAGLSEEYVASYLIAIAIYRKCDKTTWKNLFIRLKSQTSISINFLYKLLPLGADNDTTKKAILDEIAAMNEVWDFLNDANDLDTGSVGGKHFMDLLGVPMTAESVINNAEATVDSLGFNVRIDK